MSPEQLGEFQKLLEVFWVRYRPGSQPSRTDIVGYWEALKPYDIRVVLKAFERTYSQHDRSRLPTAQYIVGMADNEMKAARYRRKPIHPNQKSFPVKEAKPERSHGADVIGKAYYELRDAQAAMGEPKHEADMACLAMIIEKIGSPEIPIITDPAYLPKNHRR